MAKTLAYNQSLKEVFQPEKNLKQQDIKILIVDDMPDNLRVLAETLSEYNYDTRCAKSGLMALKAVELALPDLILLDITMPGLDGYQVCQQLKENRQTQQVPIIFISALDEAWDKVKAFSVGGVDYITKPFQVEEVLARVRNQLNLKAAQVQLAQAEKMSGLGQLTAGIAHEINNPANFIFGNVKYVNQGIQDLFDLLALYETHYHSPHPEILSVVQDIDLDHLKKDLPLATKSMAAGAERISEIVQSLRNFSRLDEEGHKAVDIHEGINSTLLMLDHRLKVSTDDDAQSDDAQLKRSKIEVVKAFGDLPKVDCYPGLLNQVFMHILANAIDAIHAQVKQKLVSECNSQPQITIRTRRVDEQWIELEVEDNGVGMSAAVQDQLFTPFFSTKISGKGTGLGLAISQQIIVDKHRGDLHCQSILGEGTLFKIKLPIKAQATA
ncbi:MAG: response regulator [Cyanobacteria bacterium P01_D01_bin.105]